ncbi:Retrotransposon protein, putative, Ty3-gypsy subclass [Quillaja saponaria]|uniref:Retrotransposon protein, putative, Ty3-gypsy subclass n=1 Tax=Quillaja saponaria TaxID=32244 RepID=A0AAD7LME8_QUISA|nr:Retrotransposon protein, putative, Ty3-gypsy subclass [Quillaja saponaria]
MQRNGRVTGREGQQEVCFDQGSTGPSHQRLEAGVVRDVVEEIVENFYCIAAPLTRLTQKGVMFSWCETCEESFQKLKACLTSAFVLSLPSTTGKYIVFCDASRIGLGCILMQDGRVVAYASRQLKKHEVKLMILR